MSRRSLYPLDYQQKGALYKELFKPVWDLCKATIISTFPNHTNPRRVEFTNHKKQKSLICNIQIIVTVIRVRFLWA